MCSGKNICWKSNRPFFIKWVQHTYILASWIPWARLHITEVFLESRKTVHTLWALVAHNHSSSPFIQFILMVLRVHDLGRQTGVEEQTQASCKGGYLTRRPDACRAAVDQRKEKRTMPPCYNPLWGLGLLKYTHTIASGPGFCFFVLGLFGWFFFSFFVCFSFFLSVNQTHDSVSATSLMYKESFHDAHASVFILNIKCSNSIHISYYSKSCPHEDAQHFRI